MKAVSNQTHMLRCSKVTRMAVCNCQDSTRLEIGGPSSSGGSGSSRIGGSGAASAVLPFDATPTINLEALDGTGDRQVLGLCIVLHQLNVLANLL